jgi:dienelactone hydrolase
MRHAVLGLFVLAAAGCETTPPAEPTVARSAPTPPPAAITVRDVEYRAGDAMLKGHLALPAHTESPHPAVLVVHEWWGRGAHSDKSAEDLARMGYVGFAVDMYGDGRSTTDPKQAGEWAGAIKQSPETGIARVRAALDYVRALPETDGRRVACIGYCFGGTVSLESAWNGLDLRAVVSFHGGLTTPKPEQVAGVKASILVCHGADDPFEPKEQIDAFQKAMHDGKFDWEFASYGGAVHSFTNPAADGSFNAGVKYNPVAAERSWSLMRDFLAERFK